MKNISPYTQVPFKYIFRVFSKRISDVITTQMSLNVIVALCCPCAILCCFGQPSTHVNSTFHPSGV